MGKAYERVMQNRKEMNEEILSCIRENQTLFDYSSLNGPIFLPKNATTNNTYVGVNAIRLMQRAIKSGLTDNRWMTFNQAKDAGYYVRAGSTGVMCEQWTFDDKEPGNAEIPKVSYYYLFNAADIEGIEPESSEPMEVTDEYREIVEREIARQVAGRHEGIAENLINVFVRAKYGLITNEYKDSEMLESLSLIQNIQNDENYLPAMIKTAQEESDIISLNIDEALLELSTKEEEPAPVEPEPEESIDEEAPEEDEDYTFSFLEDSDTDKETESTKKTRGKTKLQDFGKKIGGARKDMWASRGLEVGDLEDMNEAEMSKYVDKNNIWKKPDYDALIAEGLPVKVAYFIKIVRDKLMNHPVMHSYINEEEKSSIRKEYINFVADLRDSVMACKTQEDVLSFRQKFLFDKGYATQRGYYSIRLTEKCQHCVDNKLYRAMYMDSYTWNYTYQKDIEKKQFGISAEKKLPVGYAIKQDSHSGTFYVVKGYRLVEDGFETWDAAKQYLTDNVKGKNRKVAFVPPQLESIKRVNLADIRHDTEITGEDYLRDFNFYGGEFGNWMNEADRKTSLNMGYEAFFDLAEALQVSNDDISFNGTLAIAFGARGKGKAAAHYEPLRKVINLTKMKGAGSLAHEWGHALDDFLGNALGYGKMLSTAGGKEFKEVWDAMTKRPATEEEKSQRYDKLLTARSSSVTSKLTETITVYEKSLEAVSPGISPEESAKYAKVLSEVKKFVCAAQSSLDTAQYILCRENIDQAKKLVTENNMNDGTLSNLQEVSYAITFIEDFTKARENYVVDTDYYKNSKAMDENTAKCDKGYWASECEMFARAFACYVMDKLKPGRSDYLCGHAEACVGLTTDTEGKLSVIKAYPQGEERSRINNSMDNLILQMKEKTLLAERTTNIRRKAR